MQPLKPTQNEKLATQALANDLLTSHNARMNREQVLARIRAIEPAIRALGAQAVYLFGSTARNEAKPTSDIDIFIDKDPEMPFGMMELTGLEFILEEALGTDVDLTTRNSLHPALRDDIEKSAIRVL